MDSNGRNKEHVKRIVDASQISRMQARMMLCQTFSIRIWGCFSVLIATQVGRTAPFPRFNTRSARMGPCKSKAALFLLSGVPTVLLIVRDRREKPGSFKAASPVVSFSGMMQTGRHLRGNYCWTSRRAFVHPSRSSSVPESAHPHFHRPFPADVSVNCFLVRDRC